jgi:hypothetical protein
MKPVRVFAVAILDIVSIEDWLEGVVRRAYRSIADPSWLRDTRDRHDRACACQFLSLPDQVQLESYRQW